MRWNGPPLVPTRRGGKRDEELPICGNDMENGEGGRCRYTIGMKSNAAW